MADTILNTAGFSTLSMKPVAGEQIDSLWGQNIADNTGYLFYRELPGPAVNLSRRGSSNFRAGSCESTSWFKKHPEFATLFGSYNGWFHNSSGQSSRVIIMVDGSTWINQTSTSVGAKVYYEGSIEKSISHIADGAFYPVHVSVGLAGQGGALDWQDEFTLTTWFKN